MGQKKLRTTASEWLCSDVRIRVYLQCCSKKEGKKTENWLWQRLCSLQYFNDLRPFFVNVLT